MSAHDRWLANYRHTVCEMWCENPQCDNHQSSITVDYEEEYGQGWTQPEDCPICHERLTFDRPPEPDDDEDTETPLEGSVSPQDAS